MPTHFDSVNDYINSFDPTVSARLSEMRRLIKKLLPHAEERISYNIPGYFNDGALIVYFSGAKNHTGMYPGRTHSKAYNQLAAKYASGKSTARFPHNEPLPVDVITKFIKVRLQEVADQKKGY